MRVALLAALLLSGCTTTVITVEFMPNADWAQVAKASNSTVLIACMADNGVVICRGSGVMVAPKTVVTARHLFRETPSAIVVQTASAKRSTAAAILRMGDDDYDDWAILTLANQLETPVMERVSGRLWHGERVVVIGYALGLIEPTVTDGRYCGQEDNPHFYRVSADSVYGNSGGGAYVWRERKLKLIGIMSRLAIARGSPVYHMAWATRIERVK